MSRSFFFERIRINVEIFCENLGDSLGSLRKPLLVLAGIALVMTLRSARQEVQNMKRSGLTAGDAYWTRNSAKSPYGSYASPYASSTPKSGMTGYTNPSYGSKPSSSSSSFGFMKPSSSSSSSSYGGSASSSYGASSSSYGSTSNYGSSSSMTTTRALSNGSSRPTAALVDQHGASVRVMDATTFKDFGGIVGFYGQVETLQAFGGSGVVEKVLQSPGQGKVLVVDGGGDTHSAIFGKSAAETAQRSGWKGVVIHGVVREASHFESLPIGVKALGSYPKKGTATQGQKGSAINIAGLTISPGMWIYCDKDGIVMSDHELTTTGAPGSVGGYTGATSTTPGAASTTGNSYGATSTGAMGATGATTGYNSMGQQQPSLSSTSTGSYGLSGSAAAANKPPGAYGSTSSSSTYGSGSSYGGTTTGGYNTGYGQRGPTDQYGRALPQGAQGGSGAYPYSHGRGLPYAAGPKRGTVRWSIFLPLVLSMVLIGCSWR